MLKGINSFWIHQNLFKYWFKYFITLCPGWPCNRNYILWEIEISNQISFFSRNVILWTLSIQIRKIPSFIKYLGLNRGRKQRTSSTKVRYSVKATKIWKILPLSFDVTKGLLISKCPFGVFKSSKKPTKFSPGFLS